MKLQYIQQTYTYIIQGGPIMIPLLVSIVVAFSYGVERWWFLKTELRFKRIIEAASTNQPLTEISTLLAISTQETGLIPNLIRTLANSQHASTMQCENMAQIALLSARNRIEKNLASIHTLGNLMPMLGLLGTVMGIIAVFKSISVSSGNPQLLSAGISQALITTQTGLAGAIPTLYAYSVLVNRANLLQNCLKMTATVMLQYCQTIEKESAHAV